MYAREGLETWLILRKDLPLPALYLCHNWMPFLKMLLIGIMHFYDTFSGKLDKFTVSSLCCWCSCDKMWRRMKAWCCWYWRALHCIPALCFRLHWRVVRIEGEVSSEIWQWIYLNCIPDPGRIKTVSGFIDQSCWHTIDCFKSVTHFCIKVNIFREHIKSFMLSEHVII